MKFATLASSALATVLVAGSALAYAPAQDPAVSPREIHQGQVTAQPTSGEAVSVSADKIYNGAELAQVGETKVNQYVFSSNEERTVSEADYR